MKDVTGAMQKSEDSFWNSSTGRADMVHRPDKENEKQMLAKRYKNFRG